MMNQAIEALKVRKAAKEELVKLRSQVLNLTQQNSKLHSEIQQKQITISTQVNQIQQKDSKINTQAIQLQQKENLIATQHTQLQKQKDAITLQTNFWSKKDETHKNKIDDQSVAELVAKDKEIYFLKAEIENLSNLVDAYQKEQNKKETLIEVLTNIIAELKTDKLDLKSDKAFLVSQNQSLKNELDSAKSLSSPKKNPPSEQKFYSHKNLFSEVLENSLELDEITAKPKTEIIGEMSSFSIIQNNDEDI